MTEPAKIAMALINTSPPLLMALAGAKGGNLWVRKKQNQEDAQSAAKDSRPRLKEKWLAKPAMGKIQIFRLWQKSQIKKQEEKE